MSQDSPGKPVWKKSDLQGMMREVLSFGPETTNSVEANDQQFSDRVKRIVQKLKELSRRIDQLSSQL